MRKVIFMSKHLHQTISGAETEEELKNFFAKFFSIRLSTKNFIDLYTEQILFEFKFDAPLKKIQERAKIVAQMLYYVRRLKYGRDARPVSQNICAVTKDFAVLFETETFAEFFDADTNDKDDDDPGYDWDLAPSSPSKKLVKALAAFAPLVNACVYDLSKHGDELEFTKLIEKIRKRQYLVVAKKRITEMNFYQIFEYWQALFGADVTNGRKASEYFITDIEHGKSERLIRGVLFRMTGGERVEKSVNVNKYDEFWNRYEKIYSAYEIIALRQKMDRMTEENFRRRTGEFYTPLPFADKAVDYLKRTLGEWWRDDNFRLWDMAAGTGNLEYALPTEALKYCYISTLIQDDADYCKSIFPDATVFQYDYLNDDQAKLPQKLRDELADPNIKWIVFINPPYVTASNFERDPNRTNKDNVSMTAIRELMTADDMGEVSRELTSQFFYRISREFKNRQAWLGVFSKVKYINSNNDQQLRDKFFKYKFERGFLFNSQNFDGCDGQWPVGFLIWNLAEQIPLEAQEISLDVYNNAVEKIAEKPFHAERREEFLNNWIDRPPCRKKFPPLSSALRVAAHNKDRRDRIAENFLASFMCVANDFTHQNYTALLSAPYVSAGAMSVTPNNFEQCLIVHMVRRLPKATWLNDRDQFMQPTKALPREFVTDAVIWSLFAPSNATVSLRDVEYEGTTYRIPNNFFPFTLAELRAWACTSPEIRWQIARATEDRFAATWIRDCRADLSAEALAVLAAGKVIYKKFYAELETLDTRRWKITDWDAGWYQVRMALGATIDLSALSKKLEPQIYELGFLRDEVKYF